MHSADYLEQGTEYTYFISLNKEMNILILLLFVFFGKAQEDVSS